MSKNELPDIAEVVACGEKILKANPDPVIRYRILRDVFELDHGNRQCCEAFQELAQTPQYRAWHTEQLADGSWGRLHSSDRSLRRRFGTTEYAVAYARSLGLDARHPPLAKTAAYLLSVLRGRRTIPDRPETNDRRPTGVRLFSGATLAHLSPQAGELNELRQEWGAVISYVFAEDEYDAEAEARAHEKIHRIFDGVFYLCCANRYTVFLLGTKPLELSSIVRRRYCRWLMGRRKGIGYVDVRFWPPPPGSGYCIAGWLRTLELLMPFQETWPRLRTALGWLWQQRRADGLWDFGPKTTHLRLSASWRTPQHRSHDHSLAPLTLITRALGAQRLEKEPFLDRNYSIDRAIYSMDPQVPIVFE